MPHEPEAGVLGEAILFIYLFKSLGTSQNTIEELGEKKAS